MIYNNRIRIYDFLLKSLRFLNNERVKMATAVTTATTPATTTTALPQTLPYKSNYEIAVNFFKDQAKNIAKAINYGFGWAAQIYPGNPTLPSVSKGAKDVKNFMSATEIPEKADKTVKSVQKFFAAPSVTSARGVLKETTGLINSTCDGIDFSSNWIPIPSHAMKSVSLVNYGATFLGAGNSAVEQAEAIHAEAGKARAGEAWNKQKILLNLINMARDVSYVALAVLGIAMVAFGVAVAPWAFLACLTSGLVFTIGGYFYEKIVDPEQKNFDKDKMIAQLKARAAASAA